nr:MerR family DNA-binding protein [Celeribacter sp. HF31]
MSLIAHARQLGFDLDAIAELIALQETPHAAHGDAHRIAKDRIIEICDRIARLRRLEAELVCVVKTCDGQSDGQPCRVLQALADHQACEGEH